VEGAEMVSAGIRGSCVAHGRTHTDAAPVAVTPLAHGRVDIS